MAWASERHGDSANRRIVAQVTGVLAYPTTAALLAQLELASVTALASWVQTTMFASFV